jgi:hypothetical protein
MDDGRWKMVDPEATVQLCWPMRASLAVLMVLPISLMPRLAGEGGPVDHWTVPVELGADGWLSYRNPRFGFILPVPPGMKALRPPENGGGQSFTTMDGKVRVAGWSSFNVEGSGDVDRLWAD